jgi:hypothetical protein
MVKMVSQLDVYVSVSQNYIPVPRGLLFWNVPPRMTIQMRTYTHGMPRLSNSEYWRTSMILIKRMISHVWVNATELGTPNDWRRADLEMSLHGGRGCGEGFHPP